MNDLEVFPCCALNKLHRTIVYRAYVRKAPKGFYIHSFLSQEKHKWVSAKFCPYCGKKIAKLNCLL